MQVAILSYNARAGDAIGNQVAEKLHYFLDQGAQARVFVEDDVRLHVAVKPHGTCVTADSISDSDWHYLESCDLTIFEYGQYFGLLQLLPRLARAKPKIIIDYHGVTPPELWGMHNREALEQGIRQRGLLWFADRVLVHSQHIAKEVQHDLGLPKERLHKLHYPVDVAAGQDQADGNYWRQRLQVENATVLLFVGRIARSKRIPTLIKALRRLADVRPEVHLLVVGDCSDVYEHEAKRCAHLAERLGVADRLHMVGRVNAEQLAHAYACADLFVTTSESEGFCIPVVEAMMHGVPVVASRATGLKDTVGDAGLTFTPGSVRDLARTIRRVLRSRSNAYVRSASTAQTQLRIAVVVSSADPQVVSGADRSLQLVARTLAQQGHRVEVLANSPQSGQRLSRLQQLVRRRKGDIARREEVRFLRQLPFAAGVIEALKQSIDRWDVITTGPYLSRTTFEIASRWPEKTLVVPCFHDEPEAKLGLWPQVYCLTTGLLYHSEVEKQFAQAELGINHPNGRVIGTCLRPASDLMAGKSDVPPVAGRYIVYCGRFAAEKNVPLLVDYARRYHAKRPHRFRFVFVGQGNVPISPLPCVHDMGVVSDSQKAAIVHSADALVNLSVNESLSLAVLEAWQHGVPVIGHDGCEIVRQMIADSKGGITVRDYADFQAALDDLWENPEKWRLAGMRGREYVQAHYENEREFAARLDQALAAKCLPLFDQMKAQGLARAVNCTRAQWRKKFAEAVDDVLHAPPRENIIAVEVRRRLARRSVAPGGKLTRIPVQLFHWGNIPALAEGPGATMCYAQAFDFRDEIPVGDVAMTSLPRMLLPGESSPLMVNVPVPEKPGDYLVRLWTGSMTEQSGNPPSKLDRISSSFELRVSATMAPAEHDCAEVLQIIERHLNEADDLQTLPDDYLDVTQGVFATLKKKIKRKLLHNFKAAYVDVLSRRQTAYNHEILTIVRDLANCCAMLDQTVSRLRKQVDELENRRSARSKALRMQVEHRGGLKTHRKRNPRPASSPE